MKIITDRRDTLAVLERCRGAQVALFSPNAELPAEMEGLLLAGQRLADEHGIRELPIALGMTGVYPDNPQLRKISTSCVTNEDLGGFAGGDVCEGCELWLRMLRVYEDLPDRFPDLLLLPFIDHGWVTDETERRMLWDETVVERMSIIMYDASKLEPEENIRLTAEYVRRFGKQVVIEGAPDRIYDPADVARLQLSREDQLSRPDEVAGYVQATGVDLVVPNLGTEHRSVATGRAERRYERVIAQAIRDLVGPIMSLHGTSCLAGKVGDTAADGICKVNFYTAMAVGAGQKIYGLLKRHAAEVLEHNNLWINSESFSHDIRRRHVAEVGYTMMNTLGYARLAESSPSVRPSLRPPNQQAVRGGAQ